MTTKLIKAIKKAAGDIPFNKLTGDVSRAVGRTLTKSTEVIAKNESFAKIFTENTLDLSRKLRGDFLKRTLGDDVFDGLSARKAAYDNDVKTLTDKLADLQSRYDINPDDAMLEELNRVNKQLVNAQKVSVGFNKNLDEITKMADHLESKRLFDKVDELKRASDDSVTKTKGFCSEHATMCVGGGITSAAAMYYGANAYSDLKEEQRQCLHLCYPEDYNTNKSNPTYKTRENASLLYEKDLGDQLCTPENMQLTGTSNCDQFCKQTCDFDFDDVVNRMFSDAGDDAVGLFNGVFEKILGEHWKWWLLLILCVPLIGLMLYMMVVKR
jgi:hypothetical protein